MMNIGFLAIVDHVVICDYEIVIGHGKAAARRGSHYGLCRLVRDGCVVAVIAVIACDGIVRGLHFTVFPDACLVGAIGEIERA